ITFTFILAAKRAALHRTGELRSAVAEDIITSLRRTGRYIDESRVRAYVSQYLVLRVKEHSRAFEGERSGADFGLVVEAPGVRWLGAHAAIENQFNGVVVQAKRNWRAKAPEQFGELSKRKRTFDFSKVRGFLALALYRFSEKADGVALRDITFAPLTDVSGNNQEFVNETNRRLKGRVIPNEVSAEQFFQLVTDFSIGTQDRVEIEEIITREKLACLRLSLRFRDDGAGFSNLLRIGHPTPTQIV